MSNHSVIEHKANYHFIKLEEDYLALCSRGKCSPHCKALILAVLESWTNTKRDRGEGEYVHLTMPQWTQYTYMLYERNVITDCIQELIKEGLVERREIVRYGQNTFEYTLLIDTVNERIKALSPKEPKEISPRLDAYLTYKDGAKKRAAERKKEVREKSPTQHVQVREKSRKVGDKSPGVREKSPQLRYGAKNQNKDTKGESTSNIPQQPPADSVPQPSSLSPSGKHLLEVYEEHKKRKVARNAKTVAAVNGLADIVVKDQDFLDVIGAMEVDPFFNDIGITLATIYSRYDEYLEKIMRKRAHPEITSNEESTRATIAHMMDKDVQRKQLERLRAEYEAKTGHKLTPLEQELRDKQAQFEAHSSGSRRSGPLPLPPYEEYKQSKVGI